MKRQGERMFETQKLKPFSASSAARVSVASGREEKLVTLARAQNCLTTKDTKIAKESKNKAIDSILELRDIEVDVEPQNPSPST